MKKFEYSERHGKFPGKAIISCPFVWGGHFADRRLWMAEVDGEVLDYDTKDALIESAIGSGLHYVVLRVHRDGSASVIRKGGPRQMHGSEDLQ